MPGNAPRDENFVPTALFEVDGSPGMVMPGQINQVTGRILVNGSGGGGGTVDTVVGTLNRITVNSADPANPIVDISTNYVGQTSITTLGTITTGVWNGTDIALADGGTGASLSDPGADRIMFWDDSAGAVTWLTVGANLSITGTTLDASGGGGITVGTTTVTSGTSTRILYNNAGVVGEYVITGTGNVVMSTSPTLVTPVLGTPTSVTLTNATGLPLSTGVTGQLPLANGGTGANLTDPGADRILFWDDSAGAVTWLTVGTGLSITTTTISATSTGDVVGPASATDNALARFDTTTGKLLQNGTVSASDVATGAVTLASIGDNDLVLQTGNATTNTFTMTDGANGSITAVLNGSGNFAVTSSTGHIVLTANATQRSFRTSGIFDSSGNEIFMYSVVGSAVNELGVTNAATGNAPLLSATGGDTNISINLVPKGTGRVQSGGVTVPTISSTDTFTNKRVTKRTGTTTSSATPTINTDNVDFYSITAQTADITSFTTNLSGTPTEGQTLWIAITGTGARAITWGASFEASTVALPTTTVTTNRLDVGFIWNTVTSKWRCIASA